jgi:hypothetical protein
MWVRRGRKRRRRCAGEKHFIVGILMLLCAVSIRLSIQWHNHAELLSSASATRMSRQEAEEDSLLPKLPLILGGAMASTNTTQHPTKEQQQRQQQRRRRRRPFVPVLASDIIMQPGFDTDPIVVEKFKLVFFTIRKTGCTVWKQLFRRMMGYDDWRTFSDSGNYRTNGLVYLHSYFHDNNNTNNNLTTPQAAATHIMNSPDYTRAMFVRDPKERFLSAYLDKAVRNPEYFDRYCCRRRGPKRTLKPECRRRRGNGNGSTTTTNNTKPPYTEFTNFVALTRGDFCRDSHWGLQSDRVEAKYFPLLDFLGHLETAHRDAKVLLQRIGAWDDYGKSGWGLHGNESIFESTSFVLHKTRRNTTTTQDDDDSKSRFLAKYYTPELESEIEERYARDYERPEFNLTLKKIKF